MNHVYRIIWSDATNTFIAVAETAGCRGKRSLGKRARALRALALATSLIAGANALASPTGGTVSAGQGSIVSSGAVTTINQTTPKMAINWQGFNVAAGETVNFVQPGSSAVALNRVLGTDGTQILGKLNANGQVFILNPNGVLFGKNAQVSVGALVASTLQMSDSDFMTGKMTFSGQGGAVTNYGKITATDGGYVALLGGKVSNAGTIVAKMGGVALGAGEQVTLDFSGDGLLKMAVDRGLADALTRNSGLIQADSGSVIMSAKSADELRASVVNNDGVIQARSLENHGGVIRLSGTQILNSGTLDAAGSGSANGGSIAVDASYAMQNSGSLNVSGAQGGSIKVNTHNLIDMGQYDASGSVQGGSVMIVADNHMEQTTAATLKADGGEGSGGTIRIFAAHDAWLSGSASANGRTGGEIAVTSADLVMAGANVRATGQDSGGRIRIGGGWQGGDADLRNAGQTRLVDTHLDVSATDKGNGGTAVVWSDNSTLFGGQIDARGGATGGDGGKVEVSSHGQLGFGGNVDTAAPKGRSGQLLLDPKNIEIVDSVSGMMILPLAGFVPAADVQFGGASIVEVPLSNAMLIASPHEKYLTTGDNGGAVRLYNSTTGALYGTLSGTSAGDQVGSGGITALNTGVVNGNYNYIVSSPMWSNPDGNAKVGAVTWLGSGLTLPASISTSNSLIGSTTNDQVGSGGIVVSTYANSLGNYLVKSPLWSSAGTSQRVGAVSLGSGTSGIIGIVSNSSIPNGGNSLSGSTTDDQVGSGDVTFLPSGNYVVSSPSWHYVSNGVTKSNAGAVTYMQASAPSGVVGAVNSLFGTTQGDQVGSGGITVLGNSNYLVSSPNWSISNGNANVGAVSFGSSAGVKGIVDSSNTANGNSLTGSTAGDMVSSGGIEKLTNGNFVVMSPNWGNGTANSKAGAVTWGGSTTVLTGVVSATGNSLTGSNRNDQVGSDGIEALTNGNYVVVSPHWANGTAKPNAGAVTFASGTAATKATVSSVNSLVGALSGDTVGSGGVTLLSNGNYVVSSPNWSNGSANPAAGAVTWGSSTTALKGVISTTGNSLTGSIANDSVGSGGIKALLNGNYVVDSPYWNNVGATSTSFLAGAVSWMNGSSAVKGTVSTLNSLYGTSTNDRVGYNGVTVLGNGNYVVGSQYWGASSGAVSWGSASVGVKGAVSTANSLIGKLDDQVGSGGIIELSNGNYVVNSPQWSVSSSTGKVGAVTKLTGTGVSSGVVSSTNSFTGSQTNDAVGSGGITVLTNGNFIVRSPDWHRGAISGAGAVSWVQSGAEVGVVSLANSLLGSSENDNVGSGAVRALSDGRALVASPLWDAPGASNAGRVDILAGKTTLSTNNFTYASNFSASSIILTSDLASLLSGGTTVALQANNDITLHNNFTGNGGNLSLQAGRSVILNGNINTSGGNLEIKANESAANSAYRDAGPAVISMAANTSITATNRNVTIDLGNDGGSTGNISLSTINAGTIRAINSGTAAASGIVLNGTLNASGSGNSIVLAGNVFTNATHQNTLVTPTGYWRVWSVTPEADDKGGLSYNFKQYNVSQSQGQLGQGLGSGNGFLHSVQAGITPNLIGTTSKVYDGSSVASLDSTNYSVTGALDHDIVTLNNPISGNYSGADVGNTFVTATGLALSALDSTGQHQVYGYSLTSPQASASIGTISPFKIQLSGARPYDGSTNVSSNILTMNQLPQGQTLKLSDVGTIGSPTVGTYHFLSNIALVSNANPAFGNAANYILDNGQHSITINRAPLTISSNATYSKTYDGGTSAAGNFAVALQNSELALGQRLDGGSFSFTDPNKGSNKEVRIGDVRVINNSNGFDTTNNYTITYQNNTSSTINPFQVKLTGQRTYDGTANAPQLTMNVLPNNETLSLSPGPATVAGKNVGTYVNVSGLALVSNPVPAQGNANNYVLADGQHSISITQAVLTLTPTGVTKTYDGTTVADSGSVVAVTPTQVFNSDRIDAYNIAFTDKNAGPNKVVQARNARIVDIASTTGNIIDSTANYVITYADSTAAIAPRVVNLSGSRAYDGSRTLSPDKFVIGHLVNGETLSLSGSVSVASQDVGLYSNISGLNLGNAPAGSDGLAANYTLSGGTHTASITPFAVNIAGTRAYDGTTVTDGSIFATAQKVGNEVLKVTGSGTVASKDVGAGQTVTSSVNNPLTLADGVDGSKASNYLLASSGNVATIVPYVVSLNGERSYDGSTSIAASVLQPSLVAGKLVNNESLTLRGSGTALSKDVGHAALVSLGSLTLADDANGGLSGNYTLSGGTHTATISQAGLTLTTDAVSKIYDGTLAASGSPVVVAGSLVTGDTLSGGSYAYLDKNAGSGKSVSASGITVNDGNGGANYAVTYVNNTHSVITPAPLTLSTGDVSKVYDGGLSANGTPVVAAGTLFGDTLSGGSYAYLDKNAGSGKSVSASAITINDGNGGANYAVSYVNNTHSMITPAPLTLSSSDVNKVFDGGLAANGTPVVTSGTLFGDTLSGGSYAYLDKNAGSGKSVSASAITVNDGNGGANYTISYVNNTNSVITPAPLTLSTGDVSKVYDGGLAANGTPVVKAGTLFGDTLSGGSYAFLDKNAGSGKSVSASAITVNDGNGGGNYAVSYVNNTSSVITPAPLTLSTADVNKVYDGGLSAHGTPVVTGGTLFGDTLSGGTYAYLDKNAGSEKSVSAGAITVNDGNGGANYAVTYVNNTHSVITPAPLTLSTVTVNKLYDGNVSAAGAPLLVSGTLYDGDTISGGSFAFTDRYVGSNKTVLVSDIHVNDANGGANYSVGYLNDTASSISASPQVIAASEQAGAIVASTLLNTKSPGADRRCILDQSKCIAALSGLPLTISGAGMKLPEALK